MDDELLFEEEDFETQFNGRTLWRVFKVGLNSWPLMLGFAVGILLVSLLEAYFTFLTKRIIDEGILANNPVVLRELTLFYAGLWFVFAILVWLFITCTGRLGHRTQYDLRKRMFDHLQNLQLSYYDQTPSGWLQARVASDAERVGDLVSWGFLDMLWAFAAISSSLIFMFFINWKLAAIVGLTIPLLLIVSVYFKKKILTEYRTVRKVNSKITNSYSESISGVRVIKALNRERTNLTQFRGLTSNMYEASFRAAWLSALFLPMVQLISAIGVAAIVWAGGWQVSVGGMSLGGIQAFVGYMTFMLWPVQQLALVYSTMQQAIASAERIFSLLDTPATIFNQDGAIDPGTLRGDIQFNAVNFDYGDDVPVITDLNLTVKHGETIAIVGPTGAGKSTIVNLLCRFYEPTGGSIHFNGRDYRDMTLESIQSRIGMVLQTPHLFSGTIAENIRYGRLEATEAEVIEGAKLAGAHDFILALENGYATDVGESGVLLSVGQKQLLSLARAILAQPDVFIMDEATSAVDTLTEALIQTGMEQLMTGRTSFVIAHRLSTIKNADRIMVLDRGRITEIGSHAELLQLRGHYYDLYTRQFRQQQSEKLTWAAATA